jgi:hypothetical protein
MAWSLPPISEFWRAVEVYLRVAYPPAGPPAAVRARLDALRRLSADDFYGSTAFERDKVEQGPPSRYMLRLGNRYYPHMKLIVERAPDGAGHLFRADTHDQHCMPEPGSRDYPAFCALCERNRAVAQDVDAQWESEGLPTFKSFLKQDLARRQARA